MSYNRTDTIMLGIYARLPVPDNAANYTALNYQDAIDHERNDLLKS